MSENRAATIERLFAHMQWANERVLGSLRAAEHPDALALFAHVLGAEELWLARLQSRKPGLAVWPELSVEACAEAAARNASALRAFLGGLDAEEARRVCDYTNSAGQRFSSRVDDILLHLALHGTYHRGQISTMLRLSGQEPAPTDMIAFVRGAPAATRRDSAGPG